MVRMTSFLLRDVSSNMAAKQHLRILLRIIIVDKTSHVYEPATDAFLLPPT